MQVCGEKQYTGAEEMETPERESKLMLLPGNLLVQIPNTSGIAQIQANSTNNHINNETLTNILKVEDIKQLQFIPTVQLLQSQFHIPLDCDSSSCSPYLPGQGILHRNKQLIRVAVTQFFKTTNLIEVYYNNENGYKGFGNIIKVIEELKKAELSYARYPSSVVNEIIAHLSEYAEVLKNTQIEDQTKREMINQEFALSNRISHAFLEPVMKKAREQSSKSYGLMFYENLKRVCFGYSSEQRGLSQELCNLIGVSRTELQNGCLLHSCFGFLSLESQYMVIMFNLQLRLAVMKMENIDKFNKRRFNVEVLQNSSLKISCVLEIEILRISFNKEPNNDHLLLVYHLFPNQPIQICEILEPKLEDDNSTKNINSLKIPALINHPLNNPNSPSRRVQFHPVNISHFHEYIKHFPS